MIKTTTLCDLCNKEISPHQHVNAQVYGSDFHLDCLTRDMILIIKILGLDEITYDNGKFIYSTTASNRIKHGNQF